jgi:hypothetical protein
MFPTKPLVFNRRVLTEAHTLLGDAAGSRNFYGPFGSDCHSGRYTAPRFLNALAANSIRKIELSEMPDRTARLVLRR